MDEQEKKSHLPLYPVPQNAPHVSAGMNVLELPKGQRPKATDVSPWYGVYCGTRSICATSGGNAGALDFGQQ